MRISRSVRRAMFVGGLALGAVQVLVATAVDPAWSASAEENYGNLCRKCHGSDGSGNGPVAAVLSTHPSDFSDCDAVAKLTPEFLTKIIGEGGAAVGRSPQMPAVGKTLTSDEIDALVGYVTSEFCKKDENH